MVSYCLIYGRSVYSQDHVDFDDFVWCFGKDAAV